MKLIFFLPLILLFVKYVKAYFILLVSLLFYSCSTGPQIQLPPQNTNYATKGYVDTATQKNISPLLVEISALKTQRVQDKKTIDSLKNVITINTIRIDTTSGSDFNIQNGIMTFNKTNLTTMIKAVIIKQIPPKTTVKTKKRK